MPTLPPGPSAPSVIQTMAWWNRPLAYLERNRARFGKRFTIRLLGVPPFVMLSDPAEIKEVFTAPADVLHPGEGASILEPVVGKNSVILLDEGAHLSQRKLMLPAFHGEKMEKLSDLVAEVTQREVESWPREHADRAALPPPGADARGDPACGLRARSRPAAGGHPHPADRVARHRREAGAA